MRKQKDKLCGRKSLGDRLRSLETDASVKLQVFEVCAVHCKLVTARKYVIKLFSRHLI